MKHCQSCGMPLNKDPQGGGRNTFKGGNSGCGTLILFIVLYIIFALMMRGC